MSVSQEEALSQFIGSQPPKHNPNTHPIGENPFVFTDSTGAVWFWDFNHVKWILMEEEDSTQQPEPVYFYDDDDLPPSIGTKRAQLAAQENKNKKRKENSDDVGQCSVYVENLPTDAEMDEIERFFSKAGIIRKDPFNGDLFIKLYKDDNNQLKGDGIITYFRPESVLLALQILDGADFRFNHPIKVSVASFEAKSKKKKSKGKSQGQGQGRKKQKIRFDQAKELSWDEESRVHVVLKGMFDPKEGWHDPHFVSDLKEDVKEECNRFGEVSLVAVFEHNPEGVVTVKFKEPESAVRCIEVMHGRWFAKRQISAEFYDGFTNYKVEEPEEAKQIRLQRWNEYLEEEQKQ